jgi:hypothetical protein
MTVIVKVHNATVKRMLILAIDHPEETMPQLPRIRLHAVRLRCVPETTEHWVELSMLELLQQIGALPQPAP